MLSSDPIMTEGLVAFLIPTGLGVLAYVAATLVARLTYPVPAHAHIARLVLLVAFVALALMLIPAEAFSGSHARYLRSGVEARSTSYGTLTIWLWFLPALLQRPRKIRIAK